MNNDQSNEKITGALESFLDETYDLNDLPGLAAGVYCGGLGLTFTGARGYADYLNRVPLHENDVFHCASVSKLFTSTAIMKLVEAGALRLDDRLAELLPDLRIADKRWETITLTQMLTHTSGLGDCADYHWNTPYYDDGALARYVYSDEVCQQPMIWEPGTGFRYSNVAYEILGHIVSVYSQRLRPQNVFGAQTAGTDSQITGGSDSQTADGSDSQATDGSDSQDTGTDSRLSYEDFIAEYCLGPADMSISTMKTYEREGWQSDTSNWPSDGDSLVQPGCGRLAMPHERGADRSIKAVKYYPYTRQHAPSSTLTSNVADLLKWGRAHLEGARADAGGNISGGNISGGNIYNSSEIYEKIWAPYAVVPNNGEEMGLGWFMRRQRVEITSDSSLTNKQQTREFKLCGHEGSDDGFRSSFWICPELDMVTVVLSNLSDAPVKKINKKLFGLISNTL